ncbi:MAG: heme A synthase [Candidatus Dormibacteraeota bacterium]|uniref:Heme A synthase n=1 Tax=Candidatus Aeolococcus gillhamiae TaxID=3127015 RepID=A0A934K2P5_9BACT|nr:heme A synthase [Candidatus Dormibacteraeota bacterium]
MTWTPSRALRRLTVATALATYLLVVMGGVVRVSGSGLGCGDRDQWPLCHGGLLPPLERTALIEFTHRWVAAIATGLVIALAVVVWTRYRNVRWLRNGATAIVVLFIAQIVLGAITVEFNLPSGVIMIHLANALLLLGALVWIAVTTATAGSARARPSLGTVRLAGVAVAATYVLALSGALVVDQGAGAACAGWPLCGNGFQFSAGRFADINLLHRVVAAIVVLLLGYSMVKMRRARPGDRALRLATLSVTLLIVAQVAAGALLVDQHLPAAVRGIHLALASALWACVVVSAVIARGVTSTEVAGGTRLDRSLAARVAAS